MIGKNVLTCEIATSIIFDLPFGGQNVVTHEIVISKISDVAISHVKFIAM